MCIIKINNHCLFKVLLVSLEGILLQRQHITQLTQRLLYKSHWGDAIAERNKPQAPWHLAWGSESRGMAVKLWKPLGKLFHWPIILRNLHFLLFSADVKNCHLYHQSLNPLFHPTCIWKMQDKFILEGGSRRDPRCQGWKM